MQAIVWWSVPLAGFVLAIVWVSVANRPRPRADTHDSVAEHERFRQAMDRQTGGQQPSLGGREDGRDVPPQRPPGSTPAGP